MEGGEGDGVSSSMAPLVKWRHDFSMVFHSKMDWYFSCWVDFHYVEGFYIISHGLSIYLMNLLIGFFSPKVDPELEVMVVPHCPQKVLMSSSLSFVAFPNLSSVCCAHELQPCMQFFDPNRGNYVHSSVGFWISICILLQLAGDGSSKSACQQRCYGHYASSWCDRYLYVQLLG
ncbi:hypothetical protein MKW94_013385 [Papaver nudicaule]|uniref:Uncharacterized protein n=1 Tax=Papaver nudicaule TaxID=74823 RepID=A0AA41VLV2_PAPNU|nr:hypothetical protein [Papaver nudicaule]